MATLVEIESEPSFQSAISNGTPSTLFVLYFKADWAQPCTQMNTILTTLASTYPADSSIAFLSIDAEALPDVSESYDVTSVPFIVLQKDGKTLETVSGSDAAKVRAAVEKHAVGKKTVPPALEATPRQQPLQQAHHQQQPQQSTNLQTNGATGSTTATKDLSGYAPKPSDPSTAPEFSSTAGSKEELFARLGNLVKAAPVMLFMKGTPSAPQCGFSRQIVGILRENGVKYGFFNILADDDVRQGLKEFADWPTFPQLWTNGELVGGLDILKEEMESDPAFLKPFVAASTAAA